jgi:DNA-binding response OmpR family regulator
MTTILESEGYSVEIAENGKEAVEKSRKKIYDIIVLDIKLPDIEGTELLKKIGETVPRTIKIMLTGFPALENAVKSLNRGADVYLMKPISPQELLRVIDQKLQEHKKNEEMDQEKVKMWIKRRAQKLGLKRPKV